jgi:HEAT repeat protein
MNKITSALKIQPGEERQIALLMALMLVTTAGSSTGGAGIDALFFSRFGVKNLPFMYILVGLVTFANLMIVSGLLGRLSRTRLYQLLPLILTMALVAFRLLVAMNLHWSYPVLYVGKEVFIALQGFFLWGLAGNLLDTRQAKRLFPLFTAGGITGTVLGSFGTPLLVQAFGAENLIVTWALGLGMAFWLCRAIIHILNSQPSQRKGIHQRQERRSNLFTEIQNGYRYARRSSLMRWFAVASVLFSILWFSLLLPFSRLATRHYPEANALAGFFGLFQGAQTILALGVSLFLTNRLFGRFGLINMILVLPVIYLAGFTALAAVPSFGIIVAARFTQLTWGQGVAETAWNATFNAIPAEQRDQVRAFINALPGQAGIVISGLILMIGDQALQPQQLYWVGWMAAVLCLCTIWQSRRAYTRALEEALRSGQPQVFYVEEQPFGGFQRDAGAVEVLLAGLSSPEANVRQLSAQILGNFPNEEARQALFRSLSDPHPNVRSACLRSIRQTTQLKAAPVSKPEGIPGEIPAIAACLGDPEPEVRFEAVETLRALASGPDDLAILLPCLADIDPTVRSRAVLTLANTPYASTAKGILYIMASEPEDETRQQAMVALGEWYRSTGEKEGEILEILSKGLGDSSAKVRHAAVMALNGFSADYLQSLVQALGDSEQRVRTAAAAALGKYGSLAQAYLIAALEQSELADGALLALEYLPSGQDEAHLRDYIARQISIALQDHDWASAVPANPTAYPSLLAESLRLRAERRALRALRAIALLGDRQAIWLALDSLQRRNPAQRAYALEALETTGNSSLTRPLLRIWETAQTAPALAEDTLLRAIQDPDPWLRACGAFAASETHSGQVRIFLERLAQTDPDSLVRETCAFTLKGEKAVKTIGTLFTMERILFLRRIPLFAGLDPVDLKQIATISYEQVYLDGEYICHYGDLGDEMYIIVSGEVRVLTETGIEIARRKAGEYVGEIAIISQEPRSATLIAAGDVRVLCLGQKQFEGILRDRPETSLAVLRELCARLKALTNSIGS